MEITVRGETVYAHTGGRGFDPAAPVAVLLHGAGMDHTAWSLLTRYLAHRGLSVLALDLPGHGRSGGTPLTSVGELSDWVVELLDTVGVERATLAGHSMGALVALDTAARHAGRSAALALFGVAERMPVHPDLLALAATDQPEAVELVVGWGFGPRGHMGGSPAPGLALLPAGRRLLQRARPGVLGVDLSLCNAYGGAADAAAAVGCPTVLVLGEGDRMTPAKAGRALAARIAGARVELLPGVGHMMMSEAPVPSARAIVGVVPRGA